MSITRAKKGTVKIVERSGMLYLDFRFNNHRFRPALNLPNTADNYSRASKIASDIQWDITTGNFDRTLIKYLGSKKVEPTKTSKPNHDLLSGFTYWYESRELSGNTEEGVRRFIRRANPTWKNLVDCVEAQNWSASTHNRYCKLLNQFLEWAIENYDIKPIKLVMKKGDKRVESKRKPFTDSEIKTILDAFKDGYEAHGTVFGTQKHYYPFVQFLFLTGCRMGEIVGLKWKHINLVDGTITIEESLSTKSNYESTRIQKSTKTGSVRVLPIPQKFLEQFLESGDTKGKEDYVFTGPKGQPINQRNFTQRVWKRVLTDLGIEYRVPYAARHTMASRAIEQGIPITGIAYLMGHADTTMVMKQYGHMINRPELPTLDIAS